MRRIFQECENDESSHNLSLLLNMDQITVLNRSLYITLQKMFPDILLLILTSHTTVIHLRITHHRVILRMDIHLTTFLLQKTTQRKIIPVKDIVEAAEVLKEALRRPNLLRRLR